jgi:tRNA(Ile)-lysidine synthase
MRLWSGCLGYNVHSMLEIVSQVLQDECQLEPDRPVVVGVSGGPDSLCTLDVLDRCGYSVVVAHFNHKLRLEADAESEVVQRIAEDRKLPFFAGEADVAALAKGRRQSIEEAARDARYRFLFDTAERVTAQAVAAGHSADDQVETLLMHLMRGAGLDGLSSMAFRTLPNAWSENIPLVRPLLSVWRTRIMDYCLEQGFQPILDATNLDQTFFRNRIRHELLPNLESYNPSIREVLWRTAQLLQSDKEFINQAVDSAWDECLVAEGTAYVVIDPQAASRQPVSVQRHLIRRAIANLRPGLRDIGFNAVENVRRYFHYPQPAAEIDLVAGLRLLSEPGRIWLAEWEADIPTCDWPQIGRKEIPFPVPGTIDLPNGWQFTSEKVVLTRVARNQVLENIGPYQAWIDGRSIQAPLEMRRRREGDRFLPLGMEGHSIKLSDFMINEKLPERARAGWPLVCCGDQIVWVPGYRLAQPFRITETTVEALKLRLTRSE